MKFIKDSKVVDSSNGNRRNLENDEKIMAISVVVPKDFNGTYCQKCPIWCDDISCSVVGVCPLN